MDMDDYIALHASTYITILVHISTMLQQYLHNADKTTHTCMEQWCVAILCSYRDNS